MTALSPITKTARLAQITGILARTRVRSQEELAELLAARGIRVTQATLSRDLEELGAVRLRGPGGALVYALPGEPGGPGSYPGGTAGPGGNGTPSGGTSPGGTSPGWAPPAGGPPARAGAGGTTAVGSLARVAAELLVSAEASANLVVLRTPAGGAQLLASAIDHAEWTSILGTVAGDDTVLVIARDPAGGDEVARSLLQLAERRAI